MLLVNFKPSVPLLPYIDRHWYCCSDAEKGLDLFPLFVGTGIDLFIHFETPFQAEEKLLLQSHIFCPRQTIDIESKGKLEFISVRFRSGSFRHFCSINFCELNNGYLSVQDIWKNEGRILVEKLNEEQSPIRRVRACLNFYRANPLWNY